jgi:hypothetical protein
MERQVYGDQPLPPSVSFHVTLDNFSQKPGFCIGVSQYPTNGNVSNGKCPRVSNSLRCNFNIFSHLPRFVWHLVVEDIIVLVPPITHVM